VIDALKLAIVDLETTGASAAGDRILEIGIKRIEEGRPVRSFSTLVDPGCRIPEWIQRLTGIHDADVEGAPTFDAVAGQVRELLAGCVFVAHNARFDYGFLRGEFQRLGQSFTAKCLCTVRLSRLLYPRFRHHGLSHLIQRFRFPCPHRHRALDDAEVVWAFLRHAEATIPAARFAAAVAALLKTPRLPPRLAPQALETLPDGPGVYIMYDEAGAPLYVGKSVDVRERVLSHFSSDLTSSKGQRLCRQTARIETRRAYGELGALLLEHSMVQQLKPLMNQRLRPRALLALRRAGPRGGYAAVRLGPLDEPLREDEVLGIFHSREKARAFLHAVAEEHRLCPKLLGLERAGGACLYTQLGRCGGACAGREPAALYNARFELAFAPRRIKAWPYPGPILVEEAAPDRASGHAFVIDRWRLVRALAYGDGGCTGLLDPAGRFDYDQYRILDRYLQQRGHLAKPLTPDQAHQLLRD
jgi:DNA polymerase-3 subunit epsilon